MSINLLKGEKKATLREEQKGKMKLSGRRY